MSLPVPFCLLVLSVSQLAVIYVGDDLTDEDAFRVVRSFSCGLPVVVSPRNRDTLATLHLDNVYEVRLFLEALVDFPCHNALTDLRNGNTSIALHQENGQMGPLYGTLITGGPLDGVPFSVPFPQRRRAWSLTARKGDRRRRERRKGHHHQMLIHQKSSFAPVAAAAALAAVAAAAAVAPAPVGASKRRDRDTTRGVQSDGGGDCSSDATSDYESSSCATGREGMEGGITNPSRSRQTARRTSSSGARNCSSARDRLTSSSMVGPTAAAAAAAGDTQRHDTGDTQAPADEAESLPRQGSRHQSDPSHRGHPPKTTEGMSY